MRLTLRTLLAYLDDVLAPEATKSIGEKIQESPMAQLLVSRIREVMRRRRLSAPEVFGPEMGIDPNIISQYLDNTLPAEQYADVERVLLASDELLAEAASCHQVLTLILGEAKEISPLARERLYALGPVEASSQLAVSTDTDLELKSRTPESISTRNEMVRTRDVTPKSHKIEEEKITTVPDYLKPTPLWNRVFPSALIAVLVLVCLALLIQPARMGLQKASDEWQRKVARGGNGGSQESNVPAENQGEEGDKDVVQIASNPGDSSSDQQPSEDNVEVAKKLPDGPEPKPPVDEPDDPLPDPAAAVKDATPEPKVADAAATPAPVPSPEKDVSEPAVNPNQTPISEILADLVVPYPSTDGIVVRRDPAKQKWFVVPHKSEMKPGERIACVEPFDGTLEFEKAGVKATLSGETVIELLLPNPAALQGFSIARGRIILQSKPQNENQHAIIGVAIGEDLWRLEMMSSETACALEVTVHEPTQFEKQNDIRWYKASLYVISGSVNWTNRTGKTVNMHDFTEFSIIPERLSAASIAPVVIPSPPDWCEAARRKAQPLRKYQTVFERLFDFDRPVEEPMLTIINNEKNPKIAELAARCLSATDNYSAMVQTLAECDHEEARFAARDGLRQWLPMIPSNGPNLKKALLAYYPESDADAIYQMLWGFSRDDVRGSKVIPLLLTSWMQSPRREIRELADFWVERLSGRPTEYKALGTATQREAHVRRLEEQIFRNEGLIKGP